MPDTHLQAEFQAFRFIQTEDVRQYNLSLLHGMNPSG